MRSINANKLEDLRKAVIDELERAYDDLYDAKTEYESGLRDGVYTAMVRVEELPLWEEINRDRNKL